MINIGIHLLMVVISFAVGAMVVVFGCTRLIRARIQLNASRRSFLAESRSDLEQGLHGMDPLVVASFPKKKFSDNFFAGTSDVQCPICLVNFGEGDMLRVLPLCGHFFHAPCIDVWLHQQPTCPVCRLSMHDFTHKKWSIPQVPASAFRSLAPISKRLPPQHHNHHHHHRHNQEGMTDSATATPPAPPSPCLFVKESSTSTL